LTTVRLRFICWLSNLLLALMVATQTYAQQPITFQYFYDELGQLVKVVDSAGNVIEYVYDEVGNMKEIKRSSVSALAIFSFTPQQGPVGTVVTIQGQGFSATPSDNTVRFNGASAEVTSATTTILVAIVPLGATTGPITITVGGATATSSQNFTVTNAPAITAVFPKAALTGMSVASFRVTGVNLTGSTFSFLPVFAPPAITVNTVSIDPTGTSATLSITVGNQAGQFVLIATNAQGSSDTTSMPSNTLTVLNLKPTDDPDGDGLSNADEILHGTDPLNPDTDGDGFPDGLEVALGSDPLSPSSVPLIQQASEADSRTVSLLNGIAPPSQSNVFEADSLTFSLLNGTTPPPPTTGSEADSLTFSVHNTAP
jgi:YD repeat-containing protein